MYAKLPHVQPSHSWGSLTILKLRTLKIYKTYGQTNRSHKLQYVIVIPLRDGFKTSTYFQFHHQFAFLWGKLQTEREKISGPFWIHPPLQTENEDFHYQDLLIWWFKTPCAPGPNSIGVQLQWETHLFAELTGLGGCSPIPPGSVSAMEVYKTKEH